MKEWIRLFIDRFKTNTKNQTEEKRKEIVITPEMRKQSEEIQNRLDNEMA